MYVRNVMSVTVFSQQQMDGCFIFSQRFAWPMRFYSTKKCVRKSLYLALLKYEFISKVSLKNLLKLSTIFLFLIWMFFFVRPSFFGIMFIYKLQYLWMLSFLLSFLLINFLWIMIITLVVITWSVAAVNNKIASVFL